MVQTRSKKNQETPPSDDDSAVEEEPTSSSSRSAEKKKRKSRQKQRKEELKSKATGVGLKISVDGGSANKKIVFDETNLPSEDEENDNASATNDDSDAEEQVNLEIPTAEPNEEDDDSDDDAVEEVHGTAARDEALDQMKTEAQQSLKTKKKRKRKARPEKSKPFESDDDEDEMDEHFFAQLDSARQEEMQQQQELAKAQARKGKHTTFVFSGKEEDTTSNPVDVNENIQVVVLKDSKSSFASTSVSEKALLYSRNRLKDGVDPLEGETERKRKRMRSGEQVQPWKRANKRFAMGRSRLSKGRPAAFFKRKKR